MSKFKFKRVRPLKEEDVAQQPKEQTPPQQAGPVSPEVQNLQNQIIQLNNKKADLEKQKAEIDKQIAALQSQVSKAGGAI